MMVAAVSLKKMHLIHPSKRIVKCLKQSCTRIRDVSCKVKILHSILSYTGTRNRTVWSFCPWFSTVWYSISPAYDPNSKDTSNSHSFCFGTHWKFENVHQYSSPKHHNTIRKTSPQHHHPSLRHQSITDTEQRHHQHKTKASPTYHQNITTQSLHITETRPRHHRHIT